MVYSALLQLEYFDAIRFTIVDNMHNLFLGTAKSFFKNILIVRDVLSNEALSTLKDRVIRMEVYAIWEDCQRKLCLHLLALLQMSVRTGLWGILALLLLVSYLLMIWLVGLVLC